MTTRRNRTKINAIQLFLFSLMLVMAGIFGTEKGWAASSGPNITPDIALNPENAVEKCKGWKIVM